MNQKITLQKPGNTPIVNVGGLFNVARLFMKDETKNPTHTFKDRLAFEMLRPIVESLNKGVPVKKTTFGSISYGNTAFSMGFFCNQLNKACGSKVVNAVAFVPPKLFNKKFGPNTEGAILDAKNVLNAVSKTCDLVEIDLSAKIYREKDLEELARKNNKPGDN